MLTKEEVKTILNHKVQLIRWDLCTYNSCLALIKAVDREIQRIESNSLIYAPTTDSIKGGKITGAKANEFDSAVEARAITLSDLKTERAGYMRTIERVTVRMDKLNESDREIIEEFFFRGKTHGAIAKEKEYTRDGIQKRIKRILEKMAKNS